MFSSFIQDIIFDISVILATSAIFVPIENEWSCFQYP